MNVRRILKVSELIASPNGGYPPAARKSGPATKQSMGQTSMQVACLQSMQGAVTMKGMLQLSFPRRHPRSMKS